MAQMRIFVSHSHQDNEWCRPFVAALKAIGYDVWYDEAGLQGGAAWVASIQHEVESRDVFLLILTPEAWESKWVQDELQLAIATRRRILPVLLRNTQISGFLLTTQWITVIGEEPQAAARAAVMAVEAPPAPGRDVAPQATTETLNDLLVLCRSLATEGRYTEALSACERALALDRNNIEVLRIKAWVLDRIGEYRLEGQTMYQILLLDPSNDRLWAYEYGFPYKRILHALDNERDLLQAYMLLSSANPYSYPDRSLLPDLLDGLNRINRLDAAMELLIQLEDDSTRIDACKLLDDMTRSDLAERLLDGWYGHVRYSTGTAGMPLCDMFGQMHRSDRTARFLEAWYGYPPRLSTLDDLPMLDIFAQTLVEAGRPDDARSIFSLIARIFETKYSKFLGWHFFQDLNKHPWRSNEERTAYRIYLATLDKLGRADEARRLEQTYRVF